MRLIQMTTTTMTTMTTKTTKTTTTAGRTMKTKLPALSGGRGVLSCCHQHQHRRRGSRRRCQRRQSDSTPQEEDAAMDDPSDGQESTLVPREQAKVREDQQQGHGLAGHDSVVHTYSTSYPRCVIISAREAIEELGASAAAKEEHMLMALKQLRAHHPQRCVRHSLDAACATARQQSPTSNNA